MSWPISSDLTAEVVVKLAAAAEQALEQVHGLFERVMLASRSCPQQHLAPLVLGQSSEDPACEHTVADVQGIVALQLLGRELIPAPIGSREGWGSGGPPECGRLRPLLIEWTSPEAQQPIVRCLACSIAHGALPIVHVIV